MEQSWGLLGPGVAMGERRSRTLDLGAVVRRFNELTVPGIGGVWFGKQLLLAAAGIELAERARGQGMHVSTVECANAVEALGCWLGLAARSWEQDRRLRGRDKMSREHGLEFKAIRKKNFYVVQPMRMATVLAMQPLGIAQSSSRRFNTFDLTDEGRAFVKASFAEFKPYRREVMSHLALWVTGQQGGQHMQTPPLSAALSPSEALPDGARKLLRDRLQRGGAESGDDKQRRRDALAWVEAIRLAPSARMDWDRCPPEITDAQHWADMRAGARLFATRDAAIDLLDALERQVARRPNERWRLQDPVPAMLQGEFEELKQRATAFLDLQHHDQEANAFCRQCAQDSAAQVLRHLVQRDGRVLRLVGDEVRPGPAFRRQPPEKELTGTGDEDEANTQSNATADIQWPPNISPRMRNLYLLNLDLHGELGDWLARVQA